jgi:hypothetical protein
VDMKKFKDVELKYNELKQQLEQAEINADDMKRELKRLMVLDDDGHYWMIGGKTGKWYRYDGTDWKIGEPYGNEAATMMMAAPQTQFMAMADPIAPVGENETGLIFPKKEEVKTEPAPAAAPAPVSFMGAPPLAPTPGAPAPVVAEGSHACRVCQSHIPVYAPYCQFCGASQKGPDKREKTQPVATAAGVPESFEIKYLNIVRLLVFCGGIGVIVGVIFGATFGIFSILGDAIYHFPLMMQETRGKIMGGLLFGALGGLGGFVLFALLGAFAAMFYNLISFIFGGIRVTIRK